MAPGQKASAVQVQSILFNSLASTLLAAFLAMFGKKWLNFHVEGSRRPQPSSGVQDEKNDYLALQDHHGVSSPHHASFTSRLRPGPIAQRERASHHYRHDSEPLFYIMVILATHYEIQLPTTRKNGGLRTRLGLEESPSQTWFSRPPCEALASFKRDFFAYLEHPNLSPGLEDFHGWLWDLRRGFVF